MAKNAQNLGTNVQATRVGDILTLTIDLSQTFGRSASGKSTIVASTQGNKAIDADTFVGVNVYRK